MSTHGDDMIWLFRLVLAHRPRKKASIYAQFTCGLASYNVSVYKFACVYAYMLY